MSSGILQTILQTIIIYLYLNDEKHLRKEGSKTDPYIQFKKLITKKYFSHDSEDSKIQKWVRDYVLTV